jgi:hypothetical protein
LISGEAVNRNMGTFGADANGEVTSGMNHEGESTKAAPRDGTPRSSEEAGESRRSEGGVCSEATSVRPTRKGRSLKDEAKPFCIFRGEVWEAYLKVKSKQGAAGLDGHSIEEFERDLKRNLYRTGWQEWAGQTLGIIMPTTRFLVTNAVLVVVALLLARVGWRLTRGAWPVQLPVYASSSSDPDGHIDDLAAQVGNVLADVFGTELVCRTVEILRQLHADVVRAWLRAPVA